ncbi:hypothetical protein, partial [Chryseobacterium indoltheticum]|uniref:hypothetical protein n=1 Tax=Chryseobacterium indoltheticum TaxID=254 RepID=UPI003F4961D7
CFVQFRPNWCLTQVERSRIGVFAFYRETLSRFSCAASLQKTSRFLILLFFRLKNYIQNHQVSEFH